MKGEKRTSHSASPQLFSLCGSTPPVSPAVDFILCIPNIEAKALSSLARDLVRASSVAFDEQSFVSNLHLMFLKAKAASERLFPHSILTDPVTFPTVDTFCTALLVSTAAIGSDGLGL